MACYADNNGIEYCTDYGIKEKYLTHYTENIHTTEELKKISMGSEEFEELCERGFEYKQDVVAHLERDMKGLADAFRQYPTTDIAKQVYRIEDLLHQIRLDLIETVWVQAGELLIASQVKKLRTIALAEWTDRLYLVAKRIEKRRPLKQAVQK